MVMGVLVLLSVSPTAGSGQRAPLPEITAGSDSDWHDLTFRIQQVERLADGARVLRVAGTYRTTPVAFAILLGPRWKAGRLGDLPLVTYSGTVTLRSLGVQSDHLLAVIDELYGTRQHPTKMRERTDFSGITLGGDPRDLNAAPVKIKLFFESDDETRYAELYLNIDSDAQTVELAEKDADYRSAIVRALRASQE
jgi:hypothetical protein